MGASKVDALLSRFPGPLSLRGIPNNNPVFVLFPVFGMMCAGAVFSGYNPVLGWLGTVVFGFLTIGTLIQSFPQSAGLVLDVDGFRRYGLFILSARSLWREVSNFTVSPIISPYTGGKVTTMIGFHDQRGERTWLGRSVLKVSFNNAGVGPVEGLSIEELLDLMTRWRERALALTPGRRTD